MSAARSAWRWFFSTGEPANDERAARPGYSAAVKRAAPSVVNIYSTQLVRPPLCKLPHYSDWCDAIVQNDPGQLTGALGSGVVVSEDGYILTNSHLISEADDILVGFANGQAAQAEIIGMDPLTDIAVIRVQARGLRAIAVGAEEDVKVGDIALAIGNPFGIGQTVSQGIVSAVGRSGVSASPYYDFVQTDAAINPGNSGGALIDTDGALIGINTLIFSQSGGSEGIGFAIPALLAMSILEEIVATGRVVRGYLGITLAAGPSPGADSGLVVQGVFHHSPAAAAEVRPGDLLLSINGRPSISSTAVIRQLAAYSPGDLLELAIVRGGKTLLVTAQSGERPAGR